MPSEIESEISICMYESCTSFPPRLILETYQLYGCHNVICHIFQIKYEDPHGMDTDMVNRCFVFTKGVKSAANMKPGSK